MHDEKNCRFITKNKIIDLTITENKILTLLLANKGNIVTHETICLEVYKQKSDYYFRSNIAVIISRLRTKLKGEIKIINKSRLGYYIG